MDPQDSKARPSGRRDGMRDGNEEEGMMAVLRIYFYDTREDALRAAKKAARSPGRWYGSVLLPDGMPGFAVYRYGSVLFQIRIRRSVPSQV